VKKVIIILALLIIGLGNIFSQDADTINRAISEGDLETLYNFVNNPDNRDQRLLTSANQAIRRYTVNDTSTVRYRTNRMDSRVRNVGNALMENVFTDPERYLPDVVTRLISGVSDQLQRVKIINDWICDNIAYDVETAYRGANRRQDYISVLNNKKAVCAGYSALFNEMCRLARIESIIINGFSKGFGYTGSIGSRTDHAWNAVKVSNKWYLLDVTWNAGYVSQTTYVKRYTTDYLFLDSRAFLYSHLPLENKYQFYAPVVTREQFMEEPLIRGVFFRYQLELRNELPRYNNLAQDGGFTFDVISRNSNVQLSSSLRTVQQQNIDGADWKARSGNTYSFIYDVPDNQNYKGYVFARLNNERRVHERISINVYEQRIIPLLDELLQNRRITQREKELFIDSYYKVQDTGNYYFLEDQFDTARNNAVIKIHPLVNLSLEMLTPVLDFNLRASPGYTGFSNNYNRRFPEYYSGFTGVSNTRLVSPIYGTLQSGSVETFVLESRDFTRFAFIINGQYRYFGRTGNGPFELSLEIPHGINELEIYGTRNNRNYETLIKYIVE